MSYNGYTNRETWLVNLHFNPESRADLDGIKDQIEEWYDGLNPFMQDMIDLQAIDWDELASHFEDEDEDEEETDEDEG